MDSADFCILALLGLSTATNVVAVDPYSRNNIDKNPVPTHVGTGFLIQ